MKRISLILIVFFMGIICYGVQDDLLNQKLDWIRQEADRLFYRKATVSDNDIITGESDIIFEIAILKNGEQLVLIEKEGYVYTPYVNKIHVQRNNNNI